MQYTVIWPCDEKSSPRGRRSVWLHSTSLSGKHPQQRQWPLIGQDLPWFIWPLYTHTHIYTYAFVTRSFGKSSDVSADARGPGPNRWEKWSGFGRSHRHARGCQRGVCGDKWTSQGAKQQAKPASRNSLHLGGHEKVKHVELSRGFQSRDSNPYLRTEVGEGEQAMRPVLKR